MPWIVEGPATLGFFSLQLHPGYERLLSLERYHLKIYMTQIVNYKLRVLG